jgi:phosphoserine phosphatase
MEEPVVAFDIDGTLTRSEVMIRFNELSERDDVKVGIITSNPPVFANSFISKYSLEPNFQQSAIVKARALLGIGMAFRPERKVYVGNSTTDEMYSRLANWEFIHAKDIDELSGLA